MSLRRRSPELALRLNSPCLRSAAEQGARQPEGLLWGDNRPEHSPYPKIRSIVQTNKGSRIRHLRRISMSKVSTRSPPLLAPSPGSAKPTLCGTPERTGSLGVGRPRRASSLSWGWLRSRWDFPRSRSCPASCGAHSSLFCFFPGKLGGRSNSEDPVQAVILRPTPTGCQSHRYMSMSLKGWF